MEPTATDNLLAGLGIIAFIIVAVLYGKFENWYINRNRKG